MFAGKNILINFKIINLKIKITLKYKLKFCDQLTQVKYCRYRNVKILLNRQTKKYVNKKHER